MSILVASSHHQWMVVLFLVVIDSVLDGLDVKIVFVPLERNLTLVWCKPMLWILRRIDVDVILNHRLMVRILHRLRRGYDQDL